MGRAGNDALEPLAIGIAGLDDILRGGLPPNCLYLISGEPGSGKTTLAIQFLLEGVKRGQKSLYVTLSETKHEITRVADSHGWDLSNIQICELIPSEQNLSADNQLTIFNPSELELGETTQAMLRAIEEFKPDRVVLDSLSELRLVAQHSLRYRRQILALKQFLAGRASTTLMLDDCSGPYGDSQLESIAHGVIILEQLANQYGAERRRLRISKIRGVSFRSGFHDFTIRRGGLDVFPRLVASEHHAGFENTSLESGNTQLDTLLAGGLPYGTSTLLLGPAGTSKSSIATQFAVSCAKKGDRAAIFVFDENINTYSSRSKQLGFGIDEHVENGTLTIQQVDPAELSAGEFAATVSRAVEGKDASGKRARVIVIDSLNGYLNAMPEEKYLTAQLHELLACLGQQGVVTIMTVTQTGMVGNMNSPVDTTYLADNVILFRFFEARGVVKKAISVLKKRSGEHEHSIRELQVDSEGIQIGEPLTNFQGVLTGVPTFVGNSDTLMQPRQKK